MTCSVLLLIWLAASIALAMLLGPYLKKRIEN